RNHQGSQRGHGPGKVLEIAHACMLESLRLVVKESAQSTAQGNHRHRGWRLESGDNSNQIAEQNKQAERGQKCRVALTVVADNLVTLALDESLDAFKHM